MGRPRGGKSNKSMEAARKEDAGSGGDEEVIPAYKRRGRIPKLVRDAVDEEEDLAADVEDGDGAEKADEDDSKTGSLENGGKKRRRRRNKKQAKRAAGSLAEEEKAEETTARSPAGFRQHGSRRKSTPRRAAEAGVDSK